MQPSKSGSYSKLRMQSVCKTREYQLHRPDTAQQAFLEESTPIPTPRSNTSSQTSCSHQRTKQSSSWPVLSAVTVLVHHRRRQRYSRRRWNSSSPGDFVGHRWVCQGRQIDRIRQRGSWPHWGYRRLRRLQRRRLCLLRGGDLWKRRGGRGGDSSTIKSQLRNSNLSFPQKNKQLVKGGAVSDYLWLRRAEDEPHSSNWVH